MTTDTKHSTPCQWITVDDQAQPDCLLINRLAPLECATCPDYTPVLSEAERTPCEVWSRVMGYHRPVSAYNAGKQQEHAERKWFREQPSARS